MQRFAKVIEDIFHVPLEEQRDTLSQKDIPDWDSMNFFLLISALEERFKVTFSGKEVASVRTIGDLKKLLSSKGVPA